MQWKITTMAVLAAAITAMHNERAEAGCNINITARNSGHEKVFFDPFEAKVKIKMGTWKRIFMGISSPAELAIAPGSHFSYVYKAFFGCKKKRRYKFVIRSYNETTKTSCPGSFYIPGPTTFTTSNNIDLGDLSRFRCTDASPGGSEPTRSSYEGGMSGWVTENEQGRIDISYSPRSLSYRVNRDGRISGGGTLTIKVSRRVMARGCRKVREITASTQRSMPMTGSLWSGFGKVDISPAECNFADKIISGKPSWGNVLGDSPFKEVCNVPDSRHPDRVFRDGTSHSLDLQFYVTFFVASGELLGQFDREVKIPVDVTCGSASASGRDTPVFRAESVQPTATLAGGRGNAMCDLSGSWRLRNTRNNDVSLLIWKIRRLTNEGSADKRNYEVMRYKDGRRFSPPASGRLYQSAGEALLFYDTPASMSRYNVSRILSLRRLTIQPGCNAMKQLQIFSSLSGSNAGTFMSFERIRTGANPAVRNPVGKPVIKGQQPVWQQNGKPGIPDNRRQEIERWDRLRGR